MVRLLVCAALAISLCETAEARAAEKCRFEGSSDYDGHVVAETDASTSDGATRVEVKVAFEATEMHFWRINYLIDEVSTVRGGELESVAVNTRQLAGDHIVRQTWDDFQRTSEGMQGRRVQGKALDDFSRHHPAFSAHWNPASFGEPWLRDFPGAAPERRPDLDLAALPPGLRSPLAAAFYWVRKLPPGGATIPVFLAGFKSDRTIDLPIARSGSAGGDAIWRAPLHYVSFYETPASVVEARISPDRRLLQLAFDLHGKRGSAKGEIHALGCVGSE